MKYDAFISYRHMPLDMEIAKKLHKGLETFHVPAAVQNSTGKKKIERVFRDQEELPIGSNLTDEISAALAESEYLVVVCSPYTPESAWVAKEIETFISMHDRSHVLAILIEGEPDESFPKQLVIDDNGNPVEPLAADVRGETKQERNKKFNTELLRLAAPILGCSYDDLKQRHRERMIRRLVIEISALAGTVALAGTMFGIYNASVAREMERLANEKAALADEKTALAEDKSRLLDEVMLEYQDKQKNQSKFYAEESISLLDQGNRRAAALIAAQGLPSEGNDRPYVAEAEFALGKALRAYDDGRSIDYDAMLHHDMVVMDTTLCEDKKHLITRDSGENLHVWSTENWNKVMMVTADIDESCYPQKFKCYESDDQNVFVAGEFYLRAYDYEGRTVWNTDFDDSILYAEMYPSVMMAFVRNKNLLEIYSLKDGSKIKSFDNNTGFSFSSKMEYDTEDEIAVVGHTFNEEGKTFLTIIDLKEDKCTDVECSGGHILQLILTAGGNIAVLSCNGDYVTSLDPGEFHLDLFSKEGERLWAINTGIKIKNPGSFTTQMVKRSGWEEESVEESILIGIDSSLYSFRESDGAKLKELMLPAEVKSILPFTTNTTVTLVYDNGDIVPMNLESELIYEYDVFRNNRTIAKALIAGSEYVVQGRNACDVNVIGYVRVDDIEQLPDLPGKKSKYGWCDAGKYYLMGNDLEGDYYFYDKDGQLLYSYDAGGVFVKCRGFYGDKTVAATIDNIYIMDPIAQSTDVISLSSLGFSNTVFDYTITNNGRYLAYYQWFDCGVIDIENRSVLFSYTLENYAGRAVVTEDGSKLFVLQKGEDLIEVDTATGDVFDFNGKRMMQLADIFGKQSVKVSSDGKLIAMGCMDGKVRIADTKSGDIYEEIPLACSDRLYLEFSPDDKYLIMQGDDYMVKVWGISEREYQAYFPAFQELKYSVMVPGSERIALVDYYMLYLMDTSEHSRIAEIYDGAVYIPDNNSIIMTHNENVYRCYYKNVDMLLEELQRQYPGDSLTTEEKIQYNID